MKNFLNRVRRVQRTRLARYRNVTMDSVIALLDIQEPDIDPRLELFCFRRFPKEPQ